MVTCMTTPARDGMTVSLGDSAEVVLIVEPFTYGPLRTDEEYLFRQEFVKRSSPHLWRPPGAELWRILNALARQLMDEFGWLELPQHEEMH